MEVVSENKFKNTTKVYYGVVKQVNNKKCTISINGKNFVLPVYGGVVFVNKTYAAIIPQNNINQACVLGESTLQSLVDTVTIPTAKEIMGINDAGMNFMVSKLSSANQLGTLNWTVKNTAAPDYLNHRVGIIGQTERMYLYDYTAQKAIWYIPTDFITNAILNSATNYSTRIDAANAIWDSMDDGKHKIGRVQISSTNYTYWAMKNSANYAVVILTTYSGANIYRVVKTNGTVSSYTYAPWSNTVTEESNYIKFPDGTLIQWGTKTFNSGSTVGYQSVHIMTCQILFQQSFVDTNYKIFGSGKFGTGAAIAFGQESGTASTGYVRVLDYASRTLSSSLTLTVNWTAIGRWK